MLLSRIGRFPISQLTKHPVEGFSAGLIDDDNVYEWEITIFGPPDTLYEGAFLRATLTFPQDFPLRPPKMKFLTEMWHPNSAYATRDTAETSMLTTLNRPCTVYKNGEVCISILHEPGADQYGFEDASERWLPVHGVESILISVISLLSADTPNTDSPANVDAAKEVREDIQGYRKKVRRLVRKSAEDCF
ncbi:BQ5605_C007g04778 [Microbotryum silenes-dioicae]|uniref:BQ5605_C007g04778 protein n=1 Tax=Microbotryum silenes-dioicae TaxID=796604 RepID=A0A2X0P3I4_9BASI|nr:BQ5605_C007g04778 [Microbotryum silenes-dioicae]